ncbi:hypothetical protein [Thalassotalea hakodatensis]|uniref:hypothetical protein n=1 Tax=Thalassotalea hakodatensis TaxID=3030492 RepID=UPI002573064F|nr:hypothetical protein [Thalassotalea hakodatensis]
MSQLQGVALAFRQETFEYEKGQAHQPISDEVLSLISQIEEQNTSVICISSDFELEKGFYSTLLSDEVFQVLASIVSKNVTKIDFSDSSISLTKDHDEPSAFNSLEALKEYFINTQPHDDIVSYRLNLPSNFSAKFDSITFCNLDKENLFSDASLLRNLKNNNSVFISKGLLNKQSALKELFCDIDCAFILSSGANDKGEASSNLAFLPYVDVIKLDKFEPSQIKAIQQPINVANNIRLTKKLSSIIEAVRGESSASTEKLTKQKKREEQKLTAISGGGFSTNSDLQSKLNTLVNNEFSQAQTKLEQELKLQSRQKNIIDSFNSTVVDKFTLFDLAREKKHNGFKLTIQESLIENVQGLLHRAFEKQLKQSLKLYQSLGESILKSVKEELAKTDVNASNLELSYPKESEFWHTAQYIFEFESDYSGELKKRGFLKRLSEGRRAVFSLLMVVSLGGTMFGLSNLRSNKLIGLALFLTFIFSVVFTYRSWRAEDKETEEKEIDRAKESIKRSASQCISEAERDCAQWIKTEFDKLKKHILQSIIDATKNKSEQESNQQKAVRDKAEALLRNINKKLDESVTLSRKLESIYQEVKKEEADTRRQLMPLKK